MHAVVPELRRIMLCYDLPDELEIAPRALPVLASEVDQIAALRRDARYAPMGPLLPSIITELTHLALGGRNGDQAQAFWHLARAYRAVNSLAHKMGHHDLSNTALERVRWAAERSGDPLMNFTAGYLVAGAMLRQGAYASARRKLHGLRQELERLQPERSFTNDALAVDGALLLKLAVLESRENNPDRADDYLREAEAVAAMAGNRDSLAYEMSFGPTNIRIHEVHAMIDTGDTEQALARLTEWSDAPGQEWMPRRQPWVRGRATTSSMSHPRNWRWRTGQVRSRTFAARGRSLRITQGSTRPPARRRPRSCVRAPTLQRAFRFRQLGGSYHKLRRRQGCSRREPADNLSARGRRLNGMVSSPMVTRRPFSCPMPAHVFLPCRLVGCP
ncbi:XRE family transcriptional regulator [Streptomyces sp. M10(2022)]